MNRRIALLVAAVVVVGLAGAAAAGPIGTVVAQDDTQTADGASEGNETADISPGERLSGVVGVQNAEVTGEVESRAFEVGLNRAETPEERADIVAQRLDRSEQQLGEIEQRQRELRERRDAGELSQGAYAARMAETAARAETVERGANRTAVVAGEIPETVRADRGLDDERLETLRTRANELRGPEVAAIARGVTGTDVGGPMASERRGPPGERPMNESDRGGGPPGTVGGPPTDQSASGTDAGDAGHGDGQNRSDSAENADAQPEETTDRTNGANDTDESDETNETDTVAGGDADDADRGAGNATDADRRGTARTLAAGGGLVSLSTVSSITR